MRNPLYVLEQGAKLNRDGRRITVSKEGETLAQVAVIQVSQVVLFGNIQVTTPALRLRDPSELSSLDLLTAGPERLSELRLTRGRALGEVHNRLVQSLLAPIATMLGFVTLLLGTFSRFGIWRQIGLAIALLIFVKMVDNAAASAAQKGGPAAINYLGVVVGGGLVGILLWLSGRRRRVPQGRATAKTVAA